MKKKFWVLFILLLLSSDLFAAREKSDMSADFGFTRDRKFTVWPLLIYEREKKGDKLKVDMLFSIYRYNRGFNKHFTHSHLFPFYFKNKNENITDVRLFSFYYPSLFHYYKNRDKEIRSFRVMEFHPKVSLLDFTRSKDGLFVKNNFLFLLWHKNDVAKKKSHLVFFPIIWKYNNPEYNSLTVPGLFSYGYTADKLSSHLQITPLFFHKKSFEKSKTRIYPLWWKGEEIRPGDTIRYNHILPFYWSRSGRGKNNNIIFPFFWKLENKRYRSVTLFPFFSRGVSPDGVRGHLSLTPLYNRRWRKGKKRQSLFPIWWHGESENGERKYNHIAPIYWSVKNREKHNRVIFPLVWSLKNPGYESFTFFPLISVGQNKSGTRKHRTITPLFHHYEREGKTTTRLYPLWYKGSRTTEFGEKSYFNIVPFFWSNRGPDYNNWIGGPFIWRLENKSRSYLCVPPLFSYWQTKGTKHSVLSITPFYHHRTHISGYSNELYPIWFQGKRNVAKGVERYFNIAPLFWSNSGPGYRNWAIAPLVWSLHDKDRDVFSFPPLFRHWKSTDGKKSYLSITPLYHHIKRGNSSFNQLYPIWFQGKHKTDKGDKKYFNIAPLFWSNSGPGYRNFAIAPLVWSLHDKDRDVFSFPPLFRHWKSTDGDESYLSITPLYHRIKRGDSSFNQLYPIWFQGRRKAVDGEKSYFHIAPLFFSNRGPNYRNWWVAPLLWSLHDNKRDLLSFPPLFNYWRDTKGENSVLSITPLYHHLKQGDNYFNQLYPIWFQGRRKSDNGDQRYFNIAPLFWSNSGPGYRNWAIAPLVWSLHDKERDVFSFPPLFRHWKSTDGKKSYLSITPLYHHIKRGESSFNQLYPIWFQGNRKTKTGEKKYFNIAPLFWSNRGPDYRNWALSPIMWSLHDKNRDLFFIPPLFRHWKSTDGKNSLLSITPLYHHRVKDTYTFNRFYPIWFQGKRKEEQGYRSYFNLAPLFWSNRGPGYRNWAIAPLVWSLHDKNRDVFSFPPLFRHWKSTDGKNSLLSITPLYHHRVKDTYTFNRFYPIWFQGKRKEEQGDRSYFNLAPLFWSNRGPGYRNWAIAPLVWSLHDKDRDVFSFPPLFRHWKSTDGKNSLLSITPLYHHRVKNNYTFNRFYPIWFQGKRHFESGDRSYFHLAPVFWSMKGAGYRNWAVAPFVWNFKNRRREVFSFPPLFRHWKSTDGNSSLLSITPLYHHRIDGNYTFNRFYPIWFQGKRTFDSSKRSYFHLAPLFWSRKGPGYCNWAVAPFVWSLHDKNRDVFSFPPLFRHYKTKDEKYSLLSITPLFHHQKRDGLVSNRFYPIWFQGTKKRTTMHRDNLSNVRYQKSDTVRYNHIAPLFWSRKGSTFHKRVFFPFYWGLEDANYSSHTLFPLFSFGNSADQRSSHLSITPLFHHREGADKITNHLYPIWFQGKRYGTSRRWDQGTKKHVSFKDTVHYNHIAPLYWSTRSSKHNNKVLFPLIWSLKNPYRSTFLVPGLFQTYKSERKNFVSLTPLARFTNTTNGYKRHIFPIWWQGQEVNKGDTSKYHHFAPLIWTRSDKNIKRRVIFPLFWNLQNPRYGSTTLFPLFSFGGSTDGTMSHLNITPLFSRRVKKTAEGVKKRSILFPLYWSFENGKRKSRVIFPLYWDINNNRDADSAYMVQTVPGLYSRKKSKDGTTSNLMLGSLFWHFENPLRQRTAFYPFFHYRNTFNVEKKFDLMFFLYRYKKAKTRTSHSVIWPLHASTRDVDYHTFRISPFFWYKKDMDSKFFIAPPLLFYKNDPHKQKFRFLWQLYAYNRVKGEKKQHSILWKLWDLNKYDNGDREFRILHYLYTNKRVKGEVERGVFPFFRFKRDAEGNRSLGILFNLFKTTKKKLQSCDDFYREQRIFWFIRIRSNYGNLSEECRKDVFKK